MTNRFQALRQRVPPSDRTVLALLLLASAVAAVRLPIVGTPLFGLFALHMALFLGFLALVAYLCRVDEKSSLQMLRPAATVAVIFTLYTSLGRLGMAAFPYRADAALSDIDTWLFGVDPSLWIQRWQTPGWVEFFSFAYGAFIPYIYITITLNCLGLPPGERDEFLTGWVFTYSISYLGYIFVPAHGPVVYHADDYTVSLAGDTFYRLVLEGVEASGGLQGAFPSLHVGGSVYLCLYDLRKSTLRGLTFLPLVLLIYISTIMLRYHYVIDLIFGTIIATSCMPAGRCAYRRWKAAAERKMGVTMPPLVSLQG